MLSSLKIKLRSIVAQNGVQRYAANTTWMMLEQMARLVAGLLVGVLVARYLGPTQFGELSFAVAFVALFGAVSSLGLDSIVTRELVRDPAKMNSLLGTSFWLKLMGAVLSIIFIIVALKVAGNEYRAALYILIIAVGGMFQAFGVIDFYYQSQVLSKYVSISRLIQLLISSVIKLYLIYVNSDLIYFVFVIFLDQLTLAVFLYAAYSRQKLDKFFGYFDRTLAIKLMKESWPLILSGMVIMIYMRIDQIMINTMLGAREVGLYSAALRLSEVWYFFPMIISNSLFPALVNAKEKNVELYNSRLKYLYAGMTWVSIIIAVIMTVISPWLIDFLFGTEYVDAIPVLRIHIWSGIFVFIGVAGSKWLVNEGLQKYFSIFTAVGAVVNFILNYFFIPKFGIAGAAIATLVAQFFASYALHILFDKTRPNFWRMTTSFLVVFTEVFAFLKRKS